MKKILTFFILAIFLYCNNNPPTNKQNFYPFKDSSKIYKKQIDSLQQTIKKLHIQDSLIVDTLNKKIHELEKKLFFSPIKKSGIYLKILSTDKNKNILTIKLYIKNLLSKKLTINYNNFIIVTNIKSIIKPINFQSVKLKSNEYKELIINFNIGNENISSFNFIVPEKNLIIKKRHVE